MFFAKKISDTNIVQSSPRWRCVATASIYKMESCRRRRPSKAGSDSEERLLTDESEENIDLPPDEDHQPVAERLQEVRKEEHQEEEDRPGSVRIATGRFGFVKFFTAA